MIATVGVKGLKCCDAQMSKIANDGLTRSGWHRILYSHTYMATVGVKGLKCCDANL